ncbi:MAG: HipA N-terminal domain-containing protein [Opitutaceae bacterium]|jgi:serine/threonine-protein kinase HipA|nr:HipA N-terminal domain-containing protein [Opitutaceae bacterium]
MTDKHLQVHWWDGTLVGHLIHRGTIYFVYDETWLKHGHNLSPLALPFSPIAFNGSQGIDGLPGLIADCLPDSWGRKVARKEFAKNKWGEPSTLSLLAWRAARGPGALQFLPPLEDAGKRPGALQNISAAALARGAAGIERGEVTEVLSQLAQGGTAGGALPKAMVLAYADGTLRMGAPDGIGQPSLLRNRNEITRANLPGLEERSSVADSVIYSQSGKLPRQLLGSLFNPGASSLCFFHYGS